MYADVTGVLADEQTARWDEYIALTQVRCMFGRAGLTEQQWSAIQDAYDDLAGDETLTRDEVLAKLAAAAEDLLTDAQKALLRPRKPQHPAPPADEQGE